MFLVRRNPLALDNHINIFQIHPIPRLKSENLLVKLKDSLSSFWMKNTKKALVVSIFTKAAPQTYLIKTGVL